MSERWFRLYVGVVHDPKVQALPPPLFKFWINLLCIVEGKNGLIPPLGELKTALKARLDHVEASLKALLDRGLIDQIEGGLELHNWRKRQYKYVSSTTRVQKHRAKMKRVSDVTETPPDNRVQNTDTDKSSVLTNTPLSETVCEWFEEFWEAFPKRDGFNPRPKAEAAFNSIVEAGTEPAKLIAAARQYATQVSAIEPRYIPQAVTWLNDQGWLQITSAKADLPTIKPGMPEWDAWERYYRDEKKAVPLAMQRVKNGQQKSMTVPARWPEEIDSGYAAALELKRKLDEKAS